MANVENLLMFSLYVIMLTFATASISVPSTYGTHKYDSQTARFGIPFVRGTVYEARLQMHEGDPYLCGDEWPIQNYDDLIKPSDGRPVALLAKRGQCSFEAKARTAMTLTPPGIVKYIIVYDDKERPTLSIMSAMDPSSITIGLLFVSFNSGVDLIVQIMSQSTSMYQAGGFLVRLDSENPWLPFIATDTKSWMIVSLTGIFLMLVFCGCAFFFIHLGILRIEANVIYLRGQSPHYTLLTPQQVLDLPEQTYQRDIGLGQEFCSICLEEFSNGETIKQLACSHIFHTQCILPWVTERQPLCPLCKTEVTPALSTTQQTEYSSISLQSNSTQQSLTSSRPSERFGRFCLLFGCCRFCHRIPEEEQILLHSNTMLET